jgi:hypothetical protein
MIATAFAGPAPRASGYASTPFSVAELLLHVALAGVCLAAFAYTQARDPVAYIKFINEDQFGEYATAFCYLWTTVVFGLMAWRERSTVRKAVWLVIAAVACFIGGEEISWGQRILGISTPEALRGLNRQGELTLHNVIDTSPLYPAIGVIILVGVGISALLLSRGGASLAGAARIRMYFDAWGLPLVPVVLASWFVLTAYLFLGSKFIIGNELGELPFAIGIAFLALYCYFRFRPAGPGTARTRIGASLAVLIVTALLSQALVVLGFGGGLSYRLHHAATIEYPNRGMFRQSQLIFDYIVRHPRLVNDDTHIVHAHILRALGKESQAQEALGSALARLESSGHPHDVEYLRRKGEILMLMGRTADGKDVLARALAIDEERLATAGPAERPVVLWSLGRTLAVSGDAATATRRGREALALQPPAHTAKQIQLWIESLGKARPTAQ